MAKARFKLSINRALRYFYGAFIGVLLINIYLIFSSQNRTNDWQYWVTHTHDIIDLTQDISVSIKMAETGQRGFLLTGNATYLAPYQRGVAAIQEQLQQLRAKTQNNPQQQPKIDTLEVNIAAKLQELAQTIALEKEQQHQEALAVVKSNLGKHLMEEISAALGAIKDEEFVLLKERKAALGSSKQWLVYVIYFNIFSILILISISFVYIKVKVTDPLLELANRADQFGKDQNLADLDFKNTNNEIDKVVSTFRRMARRITRHLHIVEKAREEATKSAEAKSRFIANINHEVRTPMNGIYGALQVLKEENQTPRGTIVLEKALQSASSLLVVINDILDFSELTSGHLKIENTNFNLADLIDYVSAKHASCAKSKNIEFTTKRDLSQNYWVGDPIRLKQVLGSFLSNAVKFTEHGSVVFEAQSTQDNSAILFNITDSGIGMNEEQVSKLFDSFVQGDNSKTRKHGGAGLGMSVANALVELMHGKLSIKSKPKIGTTLVCEIPMTIGEKPNLEAATATTQYDLAGARILIAEDNEINRIMIGEMIKSTHAKLAFAVNGKEALKAATSLNFDVVLMDIQMPEMDGIQSLREIRRKKPEQIVIAVTANVLPDEQARYWAEGFNDIVAKPVDKDGLLSLLSTYIKPKSQE